MSYRARTAFTSGAQYTLSQPATASQALISHAETGHIRETLKENLSLMLLALSIFGVCATSLRAQIEVGRIVGTVKDSSGAVLTNAPVTLTNEGTGIQETTKTGVGGTYAFPALQPGSYAVEVSVTGFKTAAHTQIPVHVQEAATIDLTLVPGAAAEVITVVGDVPLLQAQDASVGLTVSDQQLNDLPLNGRNWTQLAQLSAGVTVSQEGVGDQSKGIFSANGTSYQSNDYRLDGVSDNVEVYSYNQPYAVLPPPDAIQEFKVQTSNYSAEFGRGGGAIVNATIKSGTNGIHGALWEFLRNDALDSTDYFTHAAGLRKSEYRENQFGGTIGGPVIIPHLYNGKNRTFFFFDYQGTRIIQGASVTSTVPTTSMVSSGFTNIQDYITMQSGSFGPDLLGRTFPSGAAFDPATTRSVTANTVDPSTGLVAATSGFTRDPFFNGRSVAGITDFTTGGAEANLNLLPAARFDPNALKLLALYPHPTTTSLYNNYVNNSPQSIGVNQFDIRIDQTFGARDQVFAVYSKDNETDTTPSPLPGIANGADYYAGNLLLPHDSASLGETHTFSALLQNEFRLGYNRAKGNQVNSESNTLGLPEQFGIQGIPQHAGNGGLPDIAISGLTDLGTSGFVPTLTDSNVGTVLDNLTKVYGRHTLKFGAEFNRIASYIAQPPYSHGYFGFGGSYTGSPNLAGGPGVAQILVPPTASTVPNGFNSVGGADGVNASNFGATDDVRHYIGVYANADWMASPRLTLNLGLRWDYSGPSVDTHGNQSNFIPNGQGDQFADATFLISKSKCNTPLSPSFDTLTQADNIDVKCWTNDALATNQKYNFAPRLGLAYRVTDKLVARAGYGIFYGSVIGYGQKLGGLYPFWYTLSFSPYGPNVPITYSNGGIATLEEGFNGFDLSPSGLTAEGLTLSGRQYHDPTPYTQMYNATVQYQLRQNQSITVAYVGNVGRHLSDFKNLNQPSEILPPNLPVGEQYRDYQPWPDFSMGAGVQYFDATSSYNSLQTTFEKRLSQGLTLLANYTYAKCLGDQKGSTGTTTGGYRAPTLPGFGIKADYALCDADVAHIVHISGTYEIPYGAGRMVNAHGLPNQILGGWNLNGIGNLQGGQPVTLGCTVATTTGFSCNADLVPGQNPYAGGHKVQQWLNPKAFANPSAATQVGQSDPSPLGGKPSQVRGPGIRRLDFSVFKEFPINERCRFEFRGEFFNLTNTPEFGTSLSNLNFISASTTGNFGQLTYLRDGANDPRLIQFALKLYW